MAEPKRDEKKPTPKEAEREEELLGASPRAVLALRWGLPAFTIASAAVVGSLYGIGTAILVLAGGALLGVIAILWASVRTLAGDAPITLEEAIALGAPSATEEQKRAVLQALKDLDYERSVGKISDADYEELLRRYRAEAKRLLRAVDEDLAPLRARAQAYLAEQLGQPGNAKGAAPKATRACASCQIDNDPDAVFCKKCGSKMDAPKEHQDATA